MRRALKRTDGDRAALIAQIDARIEELTRVKVEGARRSIQASITRLESQSEGKRQVRLYVEQEIGQLEALANDPGAFQHHRKAIRPALAAVEREQQPNKATKELGYLVAELAIPREYIRIALSGVNRSAASCLGPDTK